MESAGVAHAWVSSPDAVAWAAPSPGGCGTLPCRTHASQKSALNFALVSLSGFMYRVKTQVLLRRAQVVVLLETEECVHERWRATPPARAHAASIRKARMFRYSVCAINKTYGACCLSDMPELCRLN